MNEKPPSVESLLAATGFQMRHADSPERRARLRRMPQRRLVRYRRGEEPRFVYADASGCRCLYAGTRSAYERFQRLAWYRRLPREARSAVEVEDGRAMDRELWGPWDAWY